VSKRPKLLPIPFGTVFDKVGVPILSITGYPARSWGAGARFRDDVNVWHVEGVEFMECVCPPDGGGYIVIADQQKGWDFGLREPHNPPAPFALEGGGGGAVFVGVPGEDNEVNPLVNGRLDDGIERLKKIQHPQRESGLRVVAAIVRHVDMRVGKMEEFHYRSPHSFNRWIPGAKLGFRRTVSSMSVAAGPVLPIA